MGLHAATNCRCRQRASALPASRAMLVLREREGGSERNVLGWCGGCEWERGGESERATERDREKGGEGGGWKERETETKRKREMTCH